jgi:uncharacterized membrane protein
VGADHGTLAIKSRCKPSSTEEVYDGRQQAARDNARRGAVRKCSQLKTKNDGRSSLDQAQRGFGQVYGSEKECSGQTIQGRAPREVRISVVKAQCFMGDEMAVEKGIEGFPISAGILFGLGLGGLFDGIILHQVLQWHHMLTSAGYPPTTVENLQINTVVDGLFHATTYIFIALGLWLLWRASRRVHERWSWKLLPATMLIGFGAFNLVEGIVDHHLLGIHHVNETVPPEEWIYWDVGFLVWGAAMLIGGWLLLRKGQQSMLVTTSSQNKRGAEPIL